MRNLDAFSAQLVEFVRRMPDDALLALVRAQLGAARPGDPTPSQVRARVSAAAGSFDAPPARRGGRRVAAPSRRAAGTRTAGPGRKGAAKKGVRRSRTTAAGRQELLASVERIVKASSGVSASEVAKSASVPQSRASSALKELKLAKRIFQGGDRRFARYAGDARTAQGASDAARKSASGPISKRGKR